VALALSLLVAGPDTAAALPGWSLLPDPLPTIGRLNAAAAFGDAGIVVAGAGAAVTVSSDGGMSWTNVSAGKLTSASLLGVAFTDSEHGVAVGQSGTILAGAPDDLGAFAWTAADAPNNLNGDLTDVALSGSLGYAVGVGGVVLQTVDGGATWTRDSAPGAADLKAVAISADGDLAVAVGAQGTLLVNRGGIWEARESGTSGDLLDVALPAASAGATIYYCTADQVFSLQGAGPTATLPAPPLSTGGTVGTLALVESGASSRLVAGGSGGFLAGFVVGGGAWAKQTGAAASTVTALAAAGDGVCYATTAGGRVERTLSAGRGYTLTLTAKPAAAGGTPFKAIVTTGASVSLSAATNILAPGVLLLQERPTGATTWRTVASGGLGATTLNGSYAPTMNTTYRARFLFAGATAATGAGVPVGVRHKVSVAAVTFRLRLHDIYRVKGAVAPAHPSGGSVEVWTDRAGEHKLGPWHRVSAGGVAQLVDGRTFTTRTFGTPVRETYHLKIRMAGDARHLQGWSPRITVSVR
ncbi:MAG TPA: hypothetical protein VJ787_08435, partial [Thermoleophilia bacterium]|nr:hypothetical protein [Thermoleophilia bacterium]